MANGPTNALPDAAARRLSNQIARAFRGTYGANTGLRTIVRSAARQLLVAGSSVDAVARIIEEAVRNHPGATTGDRPNIVRAGSHTAMLVELTRECVTEVVLEATTSTPTIAAESSP
ncbi:MAG: hypothetical protein ACRENQ_09430 [Gemmatimonadaceae bacterium]